MSHILSWNCRGLGSFPAVGALRRIVISEHPQLVFLQETKLKQAEMENVRQKCGMHGMIVVGCGGEGRRRRGGLAILWKKEWDVTVLSFSLNHIDVIVSSQGGSEWRFTGLYGYPEDENKVKTCELLNSLANANRLPWLCGGDFNLMLWSSEKQGGGDFNFVHASSFQEALDRSELDNLYFNGHPFTWTNNQGGEKNLQERLDRFCANRGWKDSYGGSFVTHLEKRKSDHLPLVLSIKTRMSTPHKRQKKKGCSL